MFYKLKFYLITKSIYSQFIKILFLFSVNFKMNSFYKIIKKIFLFLFYKKDKNYTNKNEIINEFIPQEEIKSLIQEDLPFIKTENKTDHKKIRFKLPSIDLLKIPSKKDKEKLRDDDYIDSGFGTLVRTTMPIHKDFNTTKIAFAWNGFSL